MITVNRFQWKPHWCAALLATSILSACGGGGGSGTDAAPANNPAQPAEPVVPSAPPPYTLSPASATASHVQGYSATIDMTATQTKAFVGVAYIQAVAEHGVFQTPISVTPNANGSFAVKLTTSSTLGVGQYKGNLTVSVCADSNCKSHLEGSPFKVPYDIEVLSPDGGLLAYDLSELKPLPGAKNWETVQADPHHTGFVPVTLSPSSFKARWRWTAPAVGGTQITVDGLATGNGLFFISNGSYWTTGKGHDLSALNEHDGTEVWRHSFDDLGYANTNPPAFSNGRLFIVAGSQEYTTMYAFNAATGAEIFHKQMSSQWEHYLAPTVVDGVVYTNGGHYGGMYAFDASTGQQKFFAGLPQFDGWTPAVDSAFAYAYMNGALQIVDIRTGELAGAISDPSYSWNGYTTAGAPVIGQPGSVLAGNMSAGWESNAIVNFDTTTRTVKWLARGNYHVQPAYAQGEFLVANDKPLALESRKEADGSLLWSWLPPAQDEKFVGNIVVTNNLVFVSTKLATYAVDRATHTTKWRFEASGALSMSANGVLYINGGKKITTINLH